MQQRVPEAPESGTMVYTSNTTPTPHENLPCKNPTLTTGIYKLAAAGKLDQKICKTRFPYQNTS